MENGKVIAWYDAVDGSVAPQDSQGHGTHVASIAAGTGEGDPLVQSGVAPGAVLIGVKVFPVPLNTGAEYTLKGLEWIYENLDTYKINVVNMSIGTKGSYDSRKEVIEKINQIKAAGVPVFVAAGNEGGEEPYYGTLSTYAKYTSTSVGSIRDPYEGGWCLSIFSSRGKTGHEFPYIVSCGENVRAAKANSGNQYSTKSGTSMATPTVAGTYALMYDAIYTIGGGTIAFSGIDMGEDGEDKNYGNGRLDPYESIKKASGLGGDTNYSFSNYRNYIVDQSNTINFNQARVYEISASSLSAGADLNISAIVLDEGDAGEYKRLHIAVWEPGKNPYTGDSSTFLAYKNDDIPQNHLKIPLNQVKEGIYYIAVIGGKGENIRYTLEVTGCEILPR